MFSVEHPGRILGGNLFPNTAAAEDTYGEVTGNCIVINQVLFLLELTIITSQAIWCLSSSLSRNPTSPYLPLFTQHRYEIQTDTNIDQRSLSTESFFLGKDREFDGKDREFDEPDKRFKYVSESVPELLAQVENARVACAAPASPKSNISL